ncbi:MAG: ANTAR domain-containing protein [Lachnospiraceae bacterium]|nr:ANTAR domain-containing protein [Lachnospiraceae bacterium]
MLEIIVAFQKESDASVIKKILVRDGYCVSYVCTSGAQVLSKTDEIDEALVICGYRLNDMSFRELHDNLPENYKLLLIASAGRIAEITDNGIMSLKMPLSRAEFVDTISMIFAEDRKAKKAKRNQPRKHSDEEKEIINKAKSILMDRNNMTESEAHRYIQKNSMNSGTSLVEMAEMIIRLSRT